MELKTNALENAEPWALTQVLEGQCEKILKDLNKTNDCDYDIYKRGHYYITSPSINLRETDKFKDRYKMCVESLRRSIIALKVAGLSIKIIKLGFSNVPNSCDNILGNIGFFYIKYNFKKVKK